MDASPQYGRDYFMAELDLVYTKGITQWNQLGRDQLVTRLLPGQVLGARSTGLAQKTKKLLHMLSLESERLTGTLSRCCSILSDWGVESGIWRAPAQLLDEWKHNANYDTLFGLALFIPDADHALHHAPGFCFSQLCFFRSDLFYWFFSRLNVEEQLIEIDLKHKNIKTNSAGDGGSGIPFWMGQVFPTTATCSQPVLQQSGTVRAICKFLHHEKQEHQGVKWSGVELFFFWRGCVDQLSCHTSSHHVCFSGPKATWFLCSNVRTNMSSVAEPPVAVRAAWQVPGKNVVVVIVVSFL